LISENYTFINDSIKLPGPISKCLMRYEVYMKTSGILPFEITLL